MERVPGREIMVFGGGFTGDFCQFLRLFCNYFRKTCSGPMSSTSADPEDPPPDEVGEVREVNEGEGMRTKQRSKAATVTTFGRSGWFVTALSAGSGTKKH